MISFEVLFAYRRQVDILFMYTKLSPPCANTMHSTISRRMLQQTKNSYCSFANYNTRYQLYCIYLQALIKACLRMRRNAVHRIRTLVVTIYFNWSLVCVCLVINWNGARYTQWCISLIKESNIWLLSYIMWML